MRTLKSTTLPWMDSKCRTPFGRNWNTVSSNRARLGAWHPSVRPVCKCMHRSILETIVITVKQSPRNHTVFNFNNISRTYLKYSVNKIYNINIIDYYEASIQLIVYYKISKGWNYFSKQKKKGINYTALNTM